MDTLAFVDDVFILKNFLNRGTMTLVDETKQKSIITALQDKEVKLRSGGSAANTMFGIALSGGSAHYCGKVSGDKNGEFYRKDLLNAGINLNTQPAGEGSTGTCIVLTTPDAERTMYTNLGVSTTLSEADLELEILSECCILYLEGYLWDSESSRNACKKAAEHAKKNDVKISLTFSDPFCVDRFNEDFTFMTGEICDIIFCNADEALSFIGCENLDEAASQIMKLVELAFITNGKDGAIVINDGEMKTVPGFPVEPLDTTGAGDAFAAGVLYALSNGYDPLKSARWGNYLASETVKISGARLMESQAKKVSEIIV